jgi:phage tail tube protein FII
MPKDADRREALFARMIRSGDRLVEAQRLEVSLSGLYRQYQKGLAELTEARHWVDALAVEYADAVREWREVMEVEVTRAAARQNAMSKIWSPFGLWRKAG